MKYTSENKKKALHQTKQKRIYMNNVQISLKFTIFKN